MHTNGSQNDIRCQVTKRKISGGTRSDKGRDCRDVFLSLMKRHAPSWGLASGTILVTDCHIPALPKSHCFPTSAESKKLLDRPDFADVTPKTTEPLKTGLGREYQFDHSRL